MSESELNELIEERDRLQAFVNAPTFYLKSYPDGFYNYIQFKDGKAVNFKYNGGYDNTNYVEIENLDLTKFNYSLAEIKQRLQEKYDFIFDAKGKRARKSKSYYISMIRSINEVFYQNYAEIGRLNKIIIPLIEDEQEREQAKARQQELQNLVGTDLEKMYKEKLSKKWTEFFLYAVPCLVALFLIIRKVRK